MRLRVLLGAVLNVQLIHTGRSSPIPSEEPETSAEDTSPGYSVGP
jgi:hypothetical protein